MAATACTGECTSENDSHCSLWLSLQDHLKGLDMWLKARSRLRSRHATSNWTPESWTTRNRTTWDWSAPSRVERGDSCRPERMNWTWTPLGRGNRRASWRHRRGRSWSCRGPPGRALWREEEEEDEDDDDDEYELADELDECDDLWPIVPLRAIDFWPLATG
ncbi:unnamed protein product [Clonostachys chloroleuca]|uniref:Uncharacterized protein n=1 Tax=Clonostachys chloroleuca TaxID=1926264 RepID=A0AA35LWR7_9HYPO|nr:unnamed protein product [Clonostachys chloroleuca]